LCCPPESSYLDPWLTPTISSFKDVVDEVDDFVCDRTGDGSGSDTVELLLVLVLVVRRRSNSRLLVDNDEDKGDFDCDLAGMTFFMVDKVEEPMGI
jgi:hypothetical protein